MKNLDYSELIPENFKDSLSQFSDEKKLELLLTLLKEGRKSFNQLQQKFGDNTGYILRDITNKSPLIKKVIQKKNAEGEYSYYELSQYGENLAVYLLRFVLQQTEQ